MSIGKCTAIVLFAVITTVTLVRAQQDQTFLNDLLTELDDQSVTQTEPSAVVAANDTGSSASGNTDDLLDDLLAEDPPMKESADDADDLIGDLLSDGGAEADTGGSEASPELDIDALLSDFEESGEPVADAAVDDADDLIGDLLSDSGVEADTGGSEASPELDIDALLSDFEESGEPAADDIESMLDDSGEFGMQAEPNPIVEEEADVWAVEEVAAASVEEEAEPVPELSPAELVALAEEAAKEEKIRNETRALDGKEKLADALDSLAVKDFATAGAQFDSALVLMPDVPNYKTDRESAKWGHAEADFRLAQALFKDRKAAEALSKADAGLTYSPNHRGLTRLRGKIEKYLERHDGEPRIPVAKRSNTIALNNRIDDMIIEGRDLYKNGRLEDAETVFQQIRLLDEYHTGAMRYLKIIEDRKYKIADIEREKTIAMYNTAVRSRWNPPLKTDIAKPVIGESGDGETIVTDVATEGLVKRMKQMTIPSLEFRNANIIDVVEELRVQSAKIDPLGDGINIVLKLAAPRVNNASDLGVDSFGGAGQPGGFGDQNRGGGFGRPGGGDFLPPGSDGFGPPGSTFDGGSDGGFDDFDDFAYDDEFDDAGFDDPDTFETSTTVEVPKITLVLRRITLYDALQIITEYADLKFKIENRIVFITPSGLEEMETRVYAVQPTLVDVIIETGDSEGGGGGGGRSGEFVEIGRPVQFARADVAGFFRRAGVPIPRGASITYNPATSQIVHRNTIDNLDIFERLLPKFNVPPTQVEIEARFVEIIQEDLQELGLEWILTDDYEIARNTQDGSFISGQERVQLNANDDGFTKGLRFLTGGPTGIEGATRAESDGTGLLGDVLSFSSILTNPELKVVLHALAVSGGSDLLSAPRITTRSGIAASIEVVQEIIYPTEFEAQTAELILGSGGNNDINVDQGAGIVIFPESFETREVGVILNVTPTVGPDKYTIDLTLAPEVAELVDWIQYGTPPFNIPQPIFASRNATTSIVIWDGQTIVMGGLINELITRFDDKIPFLGDIPLLGRLFRSKGESSKKRNLLIFVTARIVDPAGQVVNQEKQHADLTYSGDDLVPISVGSGQ